MAKPPRNTVHRQLLGSIAAVAERVAHFRRNRTDSPSLLDTGEVFMDSLGDPVKTLYHPAASHALATTNMTNAEIMALLSNLCERADAQFKPLLRRRLLRLCYDALCREPISRGLHRSLARAVEAERATREVDASMQPHTIAEYLVVMEREDSSPYIGLGLKALDYYADSTLRALFREAMAHDAADRIMQQTADGSLVNRRFGDPYLEAMRQILHRCYLEWPNEFPPCTQPPLLTFG